MLLEISIENYALVRSLRIEFRAGLCAITGESGAGKSLLLGALGQVLGDRADIARISPEKTSSQISALFDVSNTPSAKNFLDAQGLDNTDAPEECLLHRRIDLSGRSRAYVNNTSVTLSTLRTLATELVDIHAQDQHHALRSHRVQQQIFDEFAAGSDQIKQVAVAWRAWRTLLDEADSLRVRVEAHKDRTELLRYQVEELDQLGLQDNEYAQIVARQSRLSRIEELRVRAGQAIDLLEHEDIGISFRLAELSGLLDQMQDNHESVQSARSAGALALSELSEASAKLRRYAEDLQAEPEELETLDSRLGAIVDLARKHRVDPADLHTQHQGLRSNLEAVTQDDTELLDTERRAEEAERTFQAHAQHLSELRRAAITEFESALLQHMAPLGLADARIQVVLTDREHEGGLESVTFHYAASESLKAVPLERVASGGERSRLALAVEILAARHSCLPTLVLDEADVGIGGRLSDEVGKLLSELSQAAQILMITHAPQVAARADAHYLVVKRNDDSVGINEIDNESRLEEIARMLGGEHLKASTRDYAGKLLASAREAI